MCKDIAVLTALLYPVANQLEILAVSDWSIGPQYLHSCIRLDKIFLPASRHFHYWLKLDFCRLLKAHKNLSKQLNYCDR